MGALMLLAWVAVSAPCHVVDGDTLRCGSERIRLLGIDAPEMRGHCRRGRLCVSGDPLASKAALEAALAGPVTIERRGHDVYGRTLAMVRAGGRDLACGQIAGGQALYRSGYDQRGVVGARCGVRR